MINSIEKIESLVEEIMAKASGKMELYIIGGGAMMYHRMKENTKDIDLVVRTERDYNVLIQTLTQSGFRSERPRSGMEKVDVSDTMVRGEYRVDVFLSKICGKLSFSKRMANRSVKMIERDGQSFSVCCLEDIFLLKSLTEREGDYGDSISILRSAKDFRWDILLEEIKEQITGIDSIWITYVSERLESINRDGYRIPIMKEVLKLNNQYMEEWANYYERRNH